MRGKLAHRRGAEDAEGARREDERPARRYAAEIACAALLLLMAANLLSVVARKGITIDETSAIPAGYYHLTERAFHINSEHPPLPKMLAALPLLFLDVEKPPAEFNPADVYSQRTVVAAQRFWPANRESFRAIFFRARVPMVALTVALGALVFVYARKLFGARAAVLSVALFALEPNMLAHGRVVKDIYVALAFLLFFFALHLYAEAPTVRRALLLGLAGGLAPAVKFSMGVVAPVLLVAAAVLFVTARRRGLSRGRLAVQLLAAALVAVVVVNASYLFSRQPVTASDMEWLARQAPEHFGLLAAALGALSTFLPPYFVFGILATLAHNEAGHPAFLLGMHSETGWWYYFPVVFALKTSLPFLCVSVAALAWSAWRLVRRRDAKFLFLVGPVALYLALAMKAQLNIGVRHLLPVFPFLFVLGGALLDRLLRAERRHALAVALVAVVLVGCVVEAARAYPNYIPYMNQLAAGRPGWHYLSDSNVEWGDDAGALAEYLKVRGETRVRAAFLGGSLVLPLYGVEYVDLLAPPGGELPRTRYVALGASSLNGSTVPGWSEGSGRETPELRQNYFAAYRTRAPEAVFGGSIYLYREEP